MFYCNVAELVGADAAQLLPLLLPCIAASLDPQRNQLSIEEIKSRDALPSISFPGDDDDDDDESGSDEGDR